MSYTLIDEPPKKGKFELIDAPPDPTGSFTENLAAGAGRAVTRLGQGAKQILDVPAQALEKAFGTFKPLGLPSAAESAAATNATVAEGERLDRPLMNTAGGVIGDVAGNVAATMLVPGSFSLGGATATGAALGGLQPVTGDESRLANTAVGAGAGAAGKVVGDKVAKTISNRLAAKTAEAAGEKTANAGRDAALAAGQEAGYVVPPRMVQKQGTPGALLEAAGGRTKLEQQASNRNQTVTNDLAKKALGVTDEGPITPEILKGIRTKAGEAYEAIRGAGQITADKQFSADLAKITQKYQGASKDFPELAKNEIGDIVASINKPSFSADAALDAISILRDKAAAAYAKGDKAVGSAYKQTSQAMEDAIERNLIEQGSTGAVKAFQAARRLIAKTYTVEKSLEAGGNVSARTIAGELKRGKPLSEELKVIGDFAGNFPKAAQNVAKVEPYSVTDAFAGAMLASAGGMPAAALPLLRPAARSVVLSDTYQKLMANPTYGTSAFLRGASKGSKVLPKLLPGLGAAEAL